MKDYVVYIIESEKNGFRYIGATKSVLERVRQHNEGLTPSTRKKGPWRLIYSERGFTSRKEAEMRERQLKRMKGGIQLKKLLQSASIV